MASFDRDSNFNAEANFTGVKFGESKPVLETELNELQEIQNEARADIIRDSIPSGFVKLGELDYNYMQNHENCVKLKTESIAYVNGYKVTIPKDTIIDLGKSPEKDIREDLIFLEVWREEVTKDSILTKHGGDHQPQITNSIKDERYPIETTRRIALKWRIRHHLNADFSEYSVDGFRKPWISWYYCNYPYAQGGNEQPLTKGVATDYKIIFSPDEDGDNKNRNWTRFDNGLFFCGNGTTETKNILKTYDGYCFAIPMFRITRKPSTVKAKPFEYEKIHPKVDYTKFSKLLSEDYVEKVENEKIMGKSLVNYSIYQDLSESYSVAKASTLKGETYYTAIFDVVNKSSTIRRVSMKVRNAWTTFLPAQVLKPGARATIKVKCTPQTAENLMNNDVVWVIENSNFQNQSISDLAITNCLLLEGDLTNENTPKYFQGLKSVAEDENNILTVKNGILEPTTYDPYYGSLKLEATEDNTYLACDNDILPDIKANLKKVDSSVVAPEINTYSKITNATKGDTLDFSEIKGRTLQNLIEITPSNIVTANENVTLDNGQIVARASSQYNGFPIATNLLFKPGTTYTLIAYVSHNTLNGRCYMTSTGEEAIFDDVTYISAGQTGVIKQVLRTKSDLSACTTALRSFVDITATTGYIRLRYVVLEGDYSQVDINTLPPNINGIKSVGENLNITLKTHGKNLINSDLFELTEEIDGIKAYVGYGYSWVDATMGKPLIFPVSKYLTPGKYTIICKNKVTNNFNKFYLYNTYTRERKNVGENWSKSWSETKIVFNLQESASFYNAIQIDTGDTNSKGYVEYISLVEGDATSYEPYCEYKKIITLKEPLRSLPNGICDTIEGNTVIRRVGKILLNGSETWRTISLTQSNYYGFSCELGIRGASTNNLYCDNFTKSRSSAWTDFLCNSISLGRENLTGLDVRIDKAKLSTPDVSGFKKWLSENPTTLYYELASPVEEKLEAVYSKESMKSYKLDAPLRSVYEIKDEIINNKVIRRCGEITFNGDDTENWIQYETPPQTPLNTAFGININNITTKTTDIVGNSYSFLFDRTFYCYTGTVNYSLCNGYLAFAKHADGRLYISVPKTFLNSQTSVSAFKQWLKSNPIKLIYELASPIEVPLKECKQTEQEVKSYVGSLYLGNGTNDILLDNKINTTDISVTSPSRSVLNKEVITDCQLKRSFSGFKLSLLRSRTKNILNPLNGTTKNSATLHEATLEKVVLSQPSTWGTYTVKLDKLLKPNTTYYVSGSINKLDDSNGYPYVQIQDVKNDKFLLTGFGKFKTPSDTSNISFFFVANDNNSRYSKVEFVKVQIEEGSSGTAFETFSPIEKAFENVDTNSIEDLRHEVSLTGFNYDKLLNDSFDKLLRGEL